jgi:uncharacterized membrane protein
MNLQNTFYLTTIVMEVLAILLIAALVILVFFIMKKLGQLSDNVNKKIDAVGQIVEHPGDIAVEAGAALVAGSFEQMKKMWNKKGRS